MQASRSGAKTAVGSEYLGRGLTQADQILAAAEALIRVLVAKTSRLTNLLPSPTRGRRWIPPSMHNVSSVVRSVTVRVPAKVNLQLSVGPLRVDGYHEIVSVFTQLTSTTRS